LLFSQEPHRRRSTRRRPRPYQPNTREILNAASVCRGGIDLLPWGSATAHEWVIRPGIGAVVPVCRSRWDVGPRNRRSQVSTVRNVVWIAVTIIEPQIRIPKRVHDIDPPDSPTATAVTVVVVSVCPAATSSVATPIASVISPSVGRVGGSCSKAAAVTAAPARAKTAAATQTASATGPGVGKGGRAAAGEPKQKDNPANDRREASQTDFHPPSPFAPPRNGSLRTEKTTPTQRAAKQVIGTTLRFPSNSVCSNFDSGAARAAFAASGAGRWSLSQTRGRAFARVRFAVARLLGLVCSIKLSSLGGGLASGDGNDATQLDGRGNFLIVGSPIPQRALTCPAARRGFLKRCEKSANRLGTLPRWCRFCTCRALSGFRTIVLRPQRVFCELAV